MIKDQKTNPISTSNTIAILAIFLYNIQSMNNIRIVASLITTWEVKNPGKTNDLLKSWNIGWVRSDHKLHK